MAYEAAVSALLLFHNCVQCAATAENAVSLRLCESRFGHLETTRLTLLLFGLCFALIHARSRLEKSFLFLSSLVIALLCSTLVIVPFSSDIQDAGRHGLVDVGAENHWLRAPNLQLANDRQYLAISLYLFPSGIDLDNNAASSFR